MRNSKRTALLSGDEAGVIEAIDRLRAGQLVAVPTETVYGLAARADNPEAVYSIFKAKGRPADHPLIVHVGHIDQFIEWASRVPDVVYQLASAFCPGPLTFILPLKEERDRTVTGGQDWVGLRIPSHPLVLQLLRTSRLAIAAPSANRFGRISPTCCDDVLEELDGLIDAVLDGGPCKIGIESTIIKVEDEQRILLLRPGHIRAEDIESVTGKAVLGHRSNKETSSELRVSGNLDSHYAPIKPAYRVRQDQLPDVVDQWKFGDWVLSYHACIEFTDVDVNVQFKFLPEQPESYAQQFYAALRFGDALKDIDRLWVLEPPSTQEWRAINDRILRATRPVDKPNMKGNI